MGGGKRGIYVRERGGIREGRDLWEEGREGFVGGRKKGFVGGGKRGICGRREERDLCEGERRDL